MRAGAGDSGAARLCLWRGLIRAALGGRCLWQGSLGAGLRFSDFTLEQSRATVSHIDTIGACLHAGVQQAKPGLCAFPCRQNLTRAPAPKPLCARHKAHPFQRGAYEASPQAQPRRAAIVYGRQPMVYAPKQYQYIADTHHPSLTFRCWRTGPRRAYRAVAARRPLRLWWPLIRAALKRGFLWQGRLRIWGSVKPIPRSVCYWINRSHFIYASCLIRHGAHARTRWFSSPAPPSFVLPAHRCLQAARARPRPKRSARRAATASHTHFFRREKAARRAYGVVGLGAGGLVCNGVSLLCGSETRTASLAGLRPLGCANSPRVFLKNRSRKALSLGH